MLARADGSWSLTTYREPQIPHPCLTDYHRYVFITSTAFQPSIIGRALFLGITGAQLQIVQSHVQEQGRQEAHP